MNPLLKMENTKINFSPSELAIYETIKKSPSLVTHLTTTALAEKCGVSQPTLTRFVKNQLGYSRYQDFRFDFINWLSSQKETNQQSNRHEYFQRLEALIKQSEELLTEEFMTSVVDFLSQANYIFTTGSAKSYLSAKLFETLMRKMGTPISCTRPDFLDDASDYMNAEDILIVFSVSAESSFIQKLSNTTCQKMLVTANPHSAYRDLFDKTVVLPTVSNDWEYDSISPILFDIFTELLVTYYAKRDFK